MTFRRVVIILLIVGGFWYLTSHDTSLIRTKILENRLHGSSLRLTEADAAPEYDAEEVNNISIYKHVLPSVVNITSQTQALNFFFQVVPQQGQGSGFILDREGHILTNYHVIGDAQQIEVTTSDKHRYRATPIGKDPVHDLALLQIHAQNLTPVTLAASSRNLEVGQKVYAIGNPFGLAGTMTTGIISAIRSIHSPQGAPIENAIQTDAAINPGNSGGPLLNSRGEVIGITSLIATNPNENVEQSAGIGFAIPIDTAKAVLGDIQKYGRVRRPSMGIISLPIGPDLAEQMGLAAGYGVLIQRTVQGGAADRAGLRGGNQTAYLGNTLIYLGGDLIVNIDGQDVTNTQDISDVMNRHQVGDTVTVTFYRGRRKMTTQVTLGEAHEQAA
ncbi:S1C family serine protease [Silvibacterium dinghuense]|uniref:Trypsin-like serine protease n=1 Tax=Silvibacterium dinghuense TaxID=1560006 RepID=A0A4Q1SKA9_9BACT|nr:trypsin-like peptidase domain-containing protein [Silvibacterium dinghuense]RXS97895.1 trypsin-like serine protease [Silvibacterium dinghuense]GGH02814.1 serine protease [Silvibacterium dinghuense]